MKPSRKYSKRIKSEDTLKLISARISLDKLFTSKRFNRNEAWKKVAAEAGVEADPEVLRKKWTNLLLKYRKLVEAKTDGRTEDGEDTASSWEYFEALHEWASKRHKNNQPETFSKERGIIYLDSSSGQTNPVTNTQKDHIASGQQDVPTLDVTPLSSEDGDIENAEDIDLFLETIIEEQQSSDNDTATTSEPRRATRKRRHSESDFNLLPDVQVHKQVLESIDSNLERMASNQQNINDLLSRLVNSAETVAKTQGSIAKSLAMIAKKLNEI